MAIQPQEATHHALVPRKYYEMFYLRLMGLTYQQIAEKTDYTYDHVRRLFSRGHACFDLWQEWLQTAKENSVDESITMMFGNLPDVVRANIMDARTPGSMVGVAARKMLFDYTLGSPEQRFKVDARIGVVTFSDWIKQQTLAEQHAETTTDQSPRLPAEPGAIPA